MSSSAHVNNTKKEILVLGKGPTRRLNNNTLTTEKEYVINSSKQQITFCLSLHYNGAKSYYLFFKGGEIYKSKQKTLK